MLSSKFVLSLARPKVTSELCREPNTILWYMFVLLEIPQRLHSLFAISFSFLSGQLAARQVAT